MKRYYWIHGLSLSPFTAEILVLFYMVGNPFLGRMELKSLDVGFLSRGEESPVPGWDGVFTMTGK